MKNKRKRSDNEPSYLSRLIRWAWHKIMPIEIEVKRGALSVGTFASHRDLRDYVAGSGFTPESLLPRLRVNVKAVIWEKELFWVVYPALILVIKFFDWRFESNRQVMSERAKGGNFAYVVALTLHHKFPYQLLAFVIGVIAQSAIAIVVGRAIADILFSGQWSAVNYTNLYLAVMAVVAVTHHIAKRLNAMFVQRIHNQWVKSVAGEQYETDNS